LKSDKGDVEETSTAGDWGDLWPMGWHWPQNAEK